MPPAPKAAAPLSPPSPSPDPAIANPTSVVETVEKDGTRRRTYRAAPKPTRSMQLVALIFVGAITSGTVGALAYSLAVNSSTTAEQQLGNIGLIGLGCLVTLLGYKAGAGSDGGSN